MFEDLIPYTKSINEQFIKGLSDEELKIFTSVLDRICNNAE
jgi:MarR family transcriptional regulator, organic hydroperoxide resistance regulator